MEISSIKLTSNEEPAGLSNYKFSDYARNYYREGSPYSHYRGKLDASLHHFGDHEHNEEAALTIFNVIQRFMMDLPEAKEGALGEEDNVFKRTMERNAELRHNSGTFKRKIDSVKRPGWQSLPELSLMSKPSSNIAKVRFICSYGISLPKLRDEIYNQLCLQLTENSSRTSTSRGWILMALCLGCFVPSRKFLNVLKNFLKQGPEGYGEYCSKRLQRTLAAGNRKLAPTFIEMHAVKVGGKIMLPVTTMDKQHTKYEVDSSTTCEELLHQLQEKLGMKSVFGFSVFAKVFDEVFNWGCGQENVLDVISLCEQYAQHKQISAKDIRGKWSIYIRKDVFLASHMPVSDPVEIDLIYNQIFGGIKVGEYVCDTDVELADFLARRYYVEHGKDFDENIAGSMLEESVPEGYLETEYKRMNLIGLIRDSINTSPPMRTDVEKDTIKQEVVSFSKRKWSREFSKTFNAVLISGRKIPKGEVKVFLNSKGVEFLSVRRDSAGFYLTLTYNDLADINNDRPKNTKDADNSSFVTFRRYDKTSYVLKSLLAVEMKKIGSILLDDYRKGDPAFLSGQILY